MRRAILHRRPPAEDGGASLEPQDLTGLFTPARWLRDLGRTSWLAVGVALFVVAAVWLLSLTQIIVMPVITAAVIAAVASPVVGRARAPGVPAGWARRSSWWPRSSSRSRWCWSSSAGSRARPITCGPSSRSAKDTSQGGSPTSASTRARRRTRRRTRRPLSSSAVPALLQGLGNGPGGAVVARRVPRVHGAEPVLPAQGRPADPRGGPRATRACPRRGPPDGRPRRCSRCAATSSASRSWRSSTPSW